MIVKFFLIKTSFDLDRNYKVELKQTYGSNEEYLKATTKIFEDLQENLFDLQQELIKAVTYVYNLDNIKSLDKYTYSERFAVYLIKKIKLTLNLLKTLKL